jgi:hypothetical protein
MQNVCHEILKDGPLVAKQIALQNVKLCAVLKHGNEETGVGHIHLERVLVSIAVKRELGNMEIIASGNDARILYPLNAASVL